MLPEDLRGLTTAQKLQQAAKFAGVPADLFDKMWERESQRGNPKWMRSPAGAEGHFGLMPATLATWEQRLGRKFDPNNFDDALVVAASTLHENMQATGNLPDALRMYNAGSNRAKWDNRETNEYVKKLTGFDQAKSAQAAAAPVQYDSDLLTTPSEAVVSGSQSTARDIQGRAYISVPQKMIDAAAMGGVSTGNPDLALTSVQKHEQEQSDKATADAHKPDRPLFLTDFGNPDAKQSVFGAFIDKHAFVEALGALDHVMRGPADPEHRAWLAKNIMKVYADAKDQGEFQTLINTKDANEYQEALRSLKLDREDTTIQQEQGGVGSFLWSLGTGLTDPVYNLAGLGVGQGFEALGISGGALVSAGKPILGVSAYMAENAGANLSVNSTLDALGKKQTLGDYFTAATTGIAFGSLHLGQALPKGTPRLGQISDSTKAALDQAMSELGADAPPAQVIERAKQIEAKPATDLLDDAIYGKSSSEVFMPRDDVDLTVRDAGAQDAMIKKYDLDARVSDGVERNVTAEVIANSEKIDSSIKNLHDPEAVSKLNPLRFLPGTESIGMTLLKSDSPVARAFAKVALEITTGAAGRRNTAAMVAHIHEQRLRATMAGWDGLKSEFIMSEGYGLLKDQVDLKGQTEFNRRVYLETLRRERGMTGQETNELVIAAADQWEKAMDALRVTQQAAKTAGHQRLGDTSVGYVPRKVLVSKVMELERTNMAGYRKVLDMLERQLTDPALDNRFDEKFARQLAKEYLERARNRWAGEGEIPMMLHEPDAAGTLRDALKGMSDVTPEEIDKFLGRYSRGGGEWTKKRLDLNLLEPIPDGKGGSMLLADIFDQDLDRLFVKQVRRVSGEAALARHNIVGEKGLKVVRDAIKLTGGSDKDLAAFDHAAADFIGRPIPGSVVNKRRIPWLDDTVIATNAMKLGASVFNQLGEYGTAVTTLGVHRVMSAIADIPRLNTEILDSAKGKVVNNPILKDFDRTAFVGGEDYHTTRLFDAADRNFEMYGDGHLSTFGRLARTAQRLQHIVSFNRRVTALQARGLAEQLLQKAFIFIRDGNQDAALKDIGIDAGMQKRLRANLDNIAKFDMDGRLTELNLYDGSISGEDLLTLQTSLYRGAGQMVQRAYIGETGTWVSDSFLRMLYQFRSVGITAMEKQWARDVANRGVGMAFAGILAGMSFGIPLQMARAYFKSQGKSKSDQEDYLRRQLAPEALALASLNYATKSGLLGDISQIGLGAYAGWSKTLGLDNHADELYQAVTAGGRQGQQDFIGGSVAPVIGTINDGFKGLSGDPARLLRVLPGANLIYLQPLLNAIQADHRN